MSLAEPSLLGESERYEARSLLGRGGSATPVALFFPAGPTFVTMLVSNVGFILMGMALATYMRMRLTAAESQLVVQAWQLRELVPRAARPALGSSMPRSRATPRARG